MARLANTLRHLSACLLGTIGMLCAATSAIATPLPQADYATRPACAAPSPGRAACLALELEPATPAARNRVHSLTTKSAPRTSLANAAECTEDYDATCVTPLELRNAYFPGETPEAPASEPQTIALVNAYNDPKAQADLETYEKEFGLNKCPAATSACFEKVNQLGETVNLPFPASEAAREAELSVCEDTHASRATREAACENVVEAEGWAVEISTDIEVARAICQNCKILLVEADSANYPDVEAAEDTAAARATEVSNSWGSEEPPTGGAAFNHPGTVITAAAGDDGYLNWTEAAEAREAEADGERTGYFAGADYPASSPDVIAVGGTRLNLIGGAWQGETVWNDDQGTSTENYGAGGSGCNPRSEAQTWQREVPDWPAVGCGNGRAVADVSADADPYTGVAVYNSVPDFHAGENDGEIVNTPAFWSPIGGTSVASPVIASMFALAGGAHSVAYPARTLYSHLGSPVLHDVTAGGNGQCDDDYSAGCAGSLTSPLDCGAGAWICNATTGYDGPTGVGTPNGLGAFKVIATPAKSQGTQGASPAGGSEGSLGASATAGGSAGATGGATTPIKTNIRPAPAPARISALALTADARSALRRDRFTLSQLAFICTLSRATTVRVTLSIKVRSGAHIHWRTLHTSLTFSALKGLNRRRLHGAGALRPGLYRLTLTPAGGAARTLAIRVL